MKNKNHIILFFFLLIISGCFAPNYLPKVDEIGVNQYGSYIVVEDTKGIYHRGELIAIDSSKLVVLINKDNIKHVSALPLKEVKGFTLKYAQPQDYSWRIPVNTLSTLVHGFFLILTAPINLIVTTVVNVSGSTDFEHSEKNMTFEKLKMFARFPQGISANINITQIK